jgi:hypothetical protein
MLDLPAAPDADFAPAMRLRMDALRSDWPHGIQRDG